MLQKVAFDELLKKDVAAAMSDLHTNMADLKANSGGLHAHEVSDKVQLMLKEYDTVSCSKEQLK